MTPEIQKKPKVSVVIPVYNVEPYLSECLDSVLSQTLKDLEVICVDDGSDDGSNAILEKYAARDARIKILHRNHVGVASARNVGLECADGEFIYFLDSDDMLIDRRAFEELHRLAESKRLDMIIFESEVFVDGLTLEDEHEIVRDYEQKYALPQGSCNRVMSGDELFVELMACGRLSVAEPMRFTRLETLRGARCRFPDGLLHEDNYFAPVSLHASKRACAIDKRYYRRRLRPHSITTSSSNAVDRFVGLYGVIRRLCAAEELWAESPQLTQAMRRYVEKTMNSVLRRCVKMERADIQAIAPRLDDRQLIGGERFFAECVFPIFRSRARLFGVRRELARLKKDNAQLRKKMKKLKRRPHTIRGCLEFALRRLWARMFRLGQKMDKKQGGVE